MFNQLRKIPRRWSGTYTPIPPTENGEVPWSTVKLGEINSDTQEREATLTAHPVLYDKNLFERASMQWQFSNWESLGKLARETPQHHPNALLATSGGLQTDKNEDTRQYIRISKKLLTRILTAGMYNSPSWADGDRSTQAVPVPYH